MSKQVKGIVIGIVIVVIIAVGVVIATKSSDDGNKTNTADSHDTTTAPSDNNAPVATDTVGIKDYMFTPMAITVKAGTTVTWTNQDSVEHSVIADTSSSDAPNGPLLAQGESYKFAFNKAGTYAIHCGPHPYMKATVTVTE